MNQILDYNPIGNTGPSGNQGGKGGTDKIVKAFAILLIFFAICLIGIGVYNKIKNSSGINVEEEKVKAEILVSEEENKLKITVNCENDLSKMVYNWNTTSERTLAIDTGKTYETTIDIPAGNNTLNIQVIDAQGNTTQYSKEFASEQGADIIEPTIEYEITDDKKIKITVKDETNLDFITYRWNDEEEVRINAEQEVQQQIITEIEIKKGENNLTIIAVDKANNTSNKQQTFTGLMQPNIKVVLSEDKSKLIVTCSHENGISKIEYTLNDKPYAGEFDNLGEVQFEQVLDEGYNKIIITATSSDGTTTTFGGECTYTPQNTVTIQ